MTVDQALVSTQTGITVVDSAQNISRVTTNTSLIGRVTIFNMSAATAVSPQDAKLLSNLGSKFSKNGLQLLVRGTVAELTNPQYAAGVAIATSTAVFDTAANILAAAGQRVITGAGSVVMSSSADVNVAGMIAFTAMPSFSVNPGAIITLADTAQNLLTIPNFAKRGALQAYKVAIDSSVNAATAVTLTALPNFSVATGVTLTIADSVSALMASTMVVRLPGFAAIPRVVIQANDTVATLLSSATPLSALATPVASLRTHATDNPTITAAQLNTLAGLPNFSASTAQGLNVSDTAAHLLTVGVSAAALVNLATITSAANVTAAQAAQLVSRFGIHLVAADMLTIVDTLAAVAALSDSVKDVAVAIVVDDSATALLAATSLPDGVTAIDLRIDGASYTIEQIEAFLALIPQGVALTLYAAGGNAELRIADTLVNLVSSGEVINAIAEFGPVRVSPTDNGGVINAEDASILANAPNFEPNLYALTVSDTGENLTEVADGIFGDGFLNITVTAGVLEASADQLLDPSLHFSEGATARLNADAIVDGATALALSGLPGFSLGTDVELIVRDHASVLADPDNAAGLALADAVILLAPALIDARQAAALADLGTRFSDGGHSIAVTDTLADLIALVNSTTLPVVNGWNGPVMLSAVTTATASEAEVLAQLDHFASGPAALTVADTIEALLNNAGEDDLPDAWTVLREASVVTLTEDGTISIDNVETLLDLGASFTRGSFDLVLVGSPSEIVLATSLVGVDLIVSGYALADQAEPWVVSPATATLLAAATNLDTGPGLVVSGTAVALLGAGSTEGFALADSVELSQDTTVGAVMAAELFNIPNFSAGAHDLTVSDSGARLASLDPEDAALATSVVLAGNSLVTVAQFSALRSLPNLDLNGRVLIVSDTATNLLSLDGSDVSLMGIALMTGTATLTADQIDALSELPHFSGRADRITVSDTVEALLHDGDAQNGPDYWAGLMLAGTVTLSADAIVTAEEATALAGLGSRFSAGAHTLVVRDTAAALLDPDNAAGLRIATSVELPDGAVTISASQAARLSLIDDLDASGSVVTVSDTYDNLSFGGFADGISHADHIQLSAAETLTVSEAIGLIGDAAFQVNEAAPITISDTLVNLLFLGSTNLANHDSILDATPIMLSHGATATVAEVMALRTLAQYDLSGGAFDLNGHHLIIRDSGAAIASFTTDSVAPPTGYVLTGDTIVTAAQATVLAGRSVVMGDSVVIVSDTPAQLLSSDNTAGLALADALMLSGDASIVASAADALFSDSRFTVGPHVLTVSDAADALLGLDPDVSYAAFLTLSEDAVVTAAQASTLAELGAHFSVGTHALVIIDTAANLLDPDNAAGLALASGVELTDGAATLSVSQAARLAAIGNLDTTDTVITISDTFDNLSHLGNAAGVDMADHVQLSAAETLTAEEAVRLIAAETFQVNTAAPITIGDTLANLLLLDDVTLPQHQAILNATPITLVGDATATVAEIMALRALAQYNLSGTEFDLDGHTLVLRDSGVNLATFTTDSVASPTSYVLTGDTVLTASQATMLAGRSVVIGDSMVTVSDTPAQLLLSGNAAGLALADTLVLSGDASVIASAADALFSDARFTVGTHVLTVSDTADALLGLDPDVSYTAFLTLSEDAVVTAAQATTLADLGAHFSVGTHTLVILDTVAALLDGANAAGLALADGVELPNGALTVTASEATRLGAIDNLDTTGTVVTISDTYANLTFSDHASAIANADHIQLAAPETLSVARAVQLIGNAAFQVNNAAPITIDDTLLNLLMLDNVSLAHHGAILDATPITLALDTYATVAQLTELRALAQYNLSGSPFSVSIYDLILRDSGRAIANFTADGVAPPTGYELSGDAVLTAAQATILANRSTTIGDNLVIVSDTAAQLLSSANAAGVALADELMLSGNATVNAADATTLFSDARFFTGGRVLTILDTADALMALDPDIVMMASMLKLSGDGSVSAAELLDLAEMGVKFSVNGHDLTVVDTASALAGLGPIELALTHTQVLGTSAVVSARTAEDLAEQSNFTLDTGVSLTIEDTVANLVELSAEAQAIATVTRLPNATSVTLTVAEAAELAAVANFSNTGATIVVSGTIAQLNASQTLAWQSIATSYEVEDTIGNIAANASALVVLNAAVVTPTGDSTIDAATAAILADIDAFDVGSMLLIVVDGPAEVAANAAAILEVATAVRINQSDDLTAAQADALAALDTAGILTFSSGHQLNVVDNFANLSDSANAEGVALADSLTIVDTASHLATASQFNWGAQSPLYHLSADASITVSAAVSLAALGSNFSAEGHDLAVTGNAAAAAAAVADLDAVGALVTVVDTAAAIGALASTLAFIDHLTISLTDSGPLSAADAAGLLTLASYLDVTPLSVADTAANVDAEVADLTSLGSDLGTVQVTDTAANIAAVASNLATLGSHIAITLTDTSPIAASVAADLLPLQARFANGTEIDVTDTAANLAAEAENLDDLGAALDEVDITGSSPVTAAVAVALLPIEDNLANGETVAVSDTVANLVTHATNLGTMSTEGRITSITASNVTAQSVVTNGATLDTLDATVSISDTAANVTTLLDNLAAHVASGLITAITLTDGGTPVVTVSVQQVHDDAAVLALIGSAFTLRVSDTAANIQADLIGGQSHILAALADIDEVVVSDAGAVELTVAQISATGVNDGTGSALAMLSGGTVVVTGATVANLDALVAMDVVPDGIEVIDTASNIATDLGTGGSDLVANRALIDSITVSGNGAISLTSARATATGVNDGTGSVMSKVSGGTFVVTGVAADDVATILALAVTPDHIDITDTAAALEANLVDSGSTIRINLADIGTITVNPAGTITLSYAQVLTAGFNDGAGSALGKMTGVTLAVDETPIDYLDDLATMTVLPTSIAIDDSVANIQADLALGAGSALVGALAQLSAVGAGPSGTVTLTAAQALVTDIDDVLALTSGVTLHITGATVAELDAIMALVPAPSDVTVSDTAANIAADIAAGGSSDLIANRAALSTVTVSDAGTISLTAAQMLATGVNDGSGSVTSRLSGGTLVVTGASVAQIDAIAALAVAADSFTVSDTAANLSTDLAAGGSSDILANLAEITSITNSNAGAITLTAAQALATDVNDDGDSAMAKVSGGTLVVTAVPVASIDAVMAMHVAATSFAVSASAAQIEADLALGGSSDIIANRALITTITNTDAGAITLTQAQVMATGINDGSGSALSKVSGGTLVVTGVSIDNVGAILALGVAPASITVSDTAVNIAADLALGASSVLVNNQSDITSVVVSDSGAVSLTLAQWQVTGVNDGTGSVADLLSGGTIVVTDLTVADIDAAVALPAAPDTLAIEDTAAHIQADLAAGGSSDIVANRADISTVVVGDSGLISLTLAQMQATGVNDGAGSAMSLLSGGTVRVTGLAVSDMDAIAALPIAPDSITVSDTAANIATDLALGGSSDLVANRALITTLTNSNAGAITLTSAQVQVTGVNDGSGSVMSKVSGGTLVVTGVAAADIDTILGLAVAPASITVSDTAANIATDLALGASSDLVTNLANITSITNSNAGAITLTSAQVQVAGVNDGAGSAMAKVTGGSLIVTGVAVADIDTILALGVSPATITISDTAANIATDLALGGSSEILAAIGTITGIVVSNAGVVSLTLAQMQAAGVNDGVGSAANLLSGGTLRVTGVTVAQLDTVAALPELPDAITVSDTAANIQSDIASGGASDLAALNASITTITNSNAGTITLTSARVQAAGVNDGTGSIMSKVSGGTLVVTGVAAADVDTVLGLAVAPASITVTDTAANIATDLALGASSELVTNLADITSITNSNAGAITLTSAQVQVAGVNDGAGSVMSKVSGGSLVVTGVAVADIDTILGLDVSPASITISDTAANIAADLALGGSSEILTAIGTITAITVSDAGVVSLSLAQMQVAGVNDGAGSAAALMSGGTLRVTGLTVAQIDTALGLPEVPDSMTVSDTAANIASDIAAGGSSDLIANRATITTITNSNAGAITLTSAEVQVAGVNDGTGSVMSKVTGGTLTVTGVAVADIDTVAGLGVAPTAMTVTGTAAQIATDLAAGGSSDILANLSAITSITNSNTGAITLTAAQALATDVNDGAGSAMSKVTGGTLVVTGATVAQLDTVMGVGVTPASVTVSDTAANIGTDLALGGASDLVGNLAAISTITVSPTGAVSVTAAIAMATDINDGAGSVFGKMSGGTVAVTEAAIADLSALMALHVAPTTIAISDTTANILSDLSGAADMAANAATITSVKPTNGSITVTNATTIFNGLVGIATFDESDLTITGTAAQLLSAHGSVPSMLTAAEAVTMSNNPTGLTAAEATTLSGILGGVLGGGQTMAVADTISNLLNGANSAGVTLATTVELSMATTTTAALATQVIAIADFNVAAQAITVNDTVANILDSANASGVAAATTVTPTTNITVTAAQLTALDAISGFGNGGHTITVQDTVTNILALSQGNLSLADTVRVADTSANVSAAINSLKTTVTDNGHSLVVALSDGVSGTPSITMTAVTYSTATAVVDAITTTGAVRVIGTASQIAALAATLAADTVVDEVYVTDTAANILSNLTTLNTLGAKFVLASLTDTTISAVEVAGLLDIPNLVATNLTVSDTGSQIAAAIAAADADGLAFINSLNVELSADSVISAADALALQGLTNLDKNGHTLKVWDSASNLTNSADGYLAAVNDASVDAVHLKAASGTATISPATAAVLLTITNFSKNNPDASTNTLIVSGTAANIETNFATLNTHASLISSVVVSASATVTDAVYAHLLTLGATAANGGVSLTVRDTAAVIAANAPTQLGSSPSITPATWALSGSASVTAANAAILGGLSGFSAGAYTLTLSANATGVSVADANKIGVLSTAFALGGHTISVAGDVATLSGLSSNAKSVVTPHITDTFANVATMTKAGNLLGGTITITDSATVTVTQATNFLDLLKVGGGAGIAAANVIFNNHIESVTDTLTNINTLTGSSGWTNNSTVHDDFNLVVADSVSTLVNGSNTSALAAMNATTFSSNQSTTAANAQTLWGVKDTIHFDRGSYTLTISDTPTNLLNPSYDDGKDFADTWQLNANASVSAADAEALLAETKFALNHTLTVSDTSDNLLDGVLSPLVNASAYKASIEIELSGAETLNARTAAKVVALHGFQNTGNLSIQDGASYLLNPANLTAETMATSVTLDGDETVSALTAYRLSVLPNFTLGSNTLYLASNDYANAATLRAIANYGSGFDVNSKSIKLTQSALDLSPTQYTALSDDNITLNGHAMSALATGVAVSSTAGTLHVTGNGVNGATLKVYASDTTLLTTVNGASASFDVTANVASIVNGIVMTSVLGGSASTGESAPVIAIERDVITNQATAGSATFATSGEVQVDTNQYMDLYMTSELPNSHANPILVYDPTAHTLSMRIDGYGSLTLVTLGTATFQTEINDEQIYVRHFS